MHLRAAVALTLAACGPRTDAGDDTGALTSDTGTSVGTTTGAATTMSPTTDALPGTTEPDPAVTSTGATTTGAPDACPDPNSFFSNGQCFCEVGYTWCSPDNDLDLTCCEEVTTMSATTDAPCPPDHPGVCLDEKNLETCVRGELVTIDCAKACVAGEIDGEKHDGGFCLLSRLSSTCACCDGDACPP
jgi:hypothetical protein